MDTDFTSEQQRDLERLVRRLPVDQRIRVLEFVAEATNDLAAPVVCLREYLFLVTTAKSGDTDISRMADTIYGFLSNHDVPWSDAWLLAREILPAVACDIAARLAVRLGLEAITSPMDATARDSVMRRYVLNERARVFGLLAVVLWPDVWVAYRSTGQAAAFRNLEWLLHESRIRPEARIAFTQREVEAVEVFENRLSALEWQVPSSGEIGEAVRDADCETTQNVALGNGFRELAARTREELFGTRNVMDLVVAR